MKKSFIIRPAISIVSTLAFLSLSSCFTQTMAPIEFKSSSTSSKSGYSERTERAVSDEAIIVKRELTTTTHSKNTSGGVLHHKDSEQEEVQAPARIEKNAVEENKNLEEELSDLEAQDLENNAMPAAIKEAPEPVTLKENSKDKFDKPVTGEIVTKFEALKDGKKSNGIDIAAKQHADIKSVGDGVVVYSGMDDKFGNLIIVKLNNSDMFAAYAHMDDLIFSQNDNISKGQVVGHVGMSGEAKRPLLHFALRKGKTPVDPLMYLK
ncbi:MAG: M23 family metallopeptidase [Pseudomonadota bacterium]